MATRSERDKCKSLQEKHQALLSQLLKEEDNKYCVDCDAKGPRWASWNLGVFLCIRCAGIHRNLGVHISRVKSVNLDSWTSEQLGMLQEMGNSRARAVYEANLPDHFRRPQTDSTLEAFIRAKYEQKKYIAKEWVPPQPKVQHTAVSEDKKEKKKARPRPSASSNIQLSGPNRPASSTSKSAATASPVANSTATPKPAPAPKKKESNIEDLIGLESTPAPAPSSNADIFSDFIGAATEPATTTATVATTNGSDGLEASLFGGSADGAPAEPPKSTKDSIMALYGSSSQPQQNPQQQQTFGVPGGMYMNQQGGQQQMGMQMGGVPMQNGMMAGANMMGGANGMMGGANGMMGGANMGMMGVPGGASNVMMTQGMQGQMMMGQMPGGMPGMQQKGQMMGMQGMGQMGQPAYSMPNQGVFNVQPQQPMAAAANQQFQQLANQMAGMSMGAQSVASFQHSQPSIAAGGAGGGGMWGGPQPGQTLSTNLWQ